MHHGFQNSDKVCSTCFDLIRSHQTRILVNRQEVRKNSQIKCLLSLDGLKSHINSSNSSLVAQLKISEASEKT